ncbi:MAG TPA: rhodanese-like domain-containing protein [Phycisphaerae bacterium]|nr:rhodanese-like domain-containing protein [Phycisphaerae bacterium]
MLLTSEREKPLSPSSAHEISHDDFRTLIQNQSALIIDARGPEQFAEGHVRGAINVPAGEMEDYAASKLQNVDRSQPIVLYCSSQTCHASEMVYEYLVGQGFTNMRVYSPGWLVLKSARDML